MSPDIDLQFRHFNKRDDILEFYIHVSTDLHHLLGNSQQQSGWKFYITINLQYTCTEDNVSALKHVGNIQK